MFHLDDYSTAEAPPADLSDTDATGASSDSQSDGGLDGCGSRSATDLANACTSAICVPFDNASRIQGFVPDAALPGLSSAGATEAGPSDAGGSGDVGGQGDAGPDATTSGAPPCSSLPSPVYIIGSSGLTSIAAELGALASTVPITVVYTTAHSCDGAKAIVLNESSFDTGNSTANYWDVSGTEHTCQIDAASEYADIGLSNVFADQCLSLPQGTSGIGDFLGPVTPGTMVVPIGSTQTAISAEALYYTFGVVNGAVSPWIDPNFLFINPNSGVQLDFGLAVGVPGRLWPGSVVSTAAQNIAKVSASSQPEKTLGTMSTDLVEAASTSPSVKELAYQDYGQHCAFYPNSTATSVDKMTVRDGHYPIWGFTHMFAKTNSQSVPLNANAGTVINYFTGNLPTPTGNFLKFVISDHLVPVCAMQVTRSSEMGPISPYTPTPGCGCYFDSIATGSSSCKSCGTAADCPDTSPHCNLGYCEAH